MRLATIFAVVLSGLSTAGHTGVAAVAYVAADQVSGRSVAQPCGGQPCEGKDADLCPHARAMAKRFEAEQMAQAFPR